MLVGRRHLSMGVLEAGIASPEVILVMAVYRSLPWYEVYVAAWIPG